MNEQQPPDTQLPATIAPTPLPVRIFDVERHGHVQVSSTEVPIRDVLEALYARRWMMIGIVAACVACAVLYNQTATPLYEARARLLIAPNSSRVVTFRPVVEEEQANLEYFQTQYEVLRSRAIAKRTLDMLDASGRGGTAAAGQPQDPSARINALLVDLTVSPVKGSRVVDVSYTSADAAYASSVVNALVRAYIEDKDEAQLHASRDASAWLTERLSALRRQVDTTQSTLQGYRERKDAVSLEDRQNIVVQKLAQLNTAVTAARTDRIAKEAVYAQLQAIERSGAGLDTFTPILSNRLVQEAKAELGALQRQRAELGQQLGDLHPDMIRVDAAIANAQQTLDREIAKVVDGIHNDYLTAVANERGLVTALEAQKAEVLDLNRKSIEYGALQREAGSTQQMFESVLQRVKEADLSRELQTNVARILDSAEVPTLPVWPRKTLNLAVALLAGLVLATGLAGGLEYLVPRLKTADDIGDALGLPLLGITPNIAKFRDAVEGPDVALPPALKEALRGIRARILLSPTSSNVRTLAVTSASSREGKTLIASNLAVSLAVTGRRVLLVDGDMRRPRLHRLFDVSRSPGLSDILSNGTKPSAAIRESAPRGLFILPAGTPPASPSDLLDTDRFRLLVRTLGDMFNLVLIDCPPVMVAADASIIANAATKGLLVIGAGRTTREAAQLAIDQLVNAQVQLIGVVLNRAPLDRHSYGAYYYNPRDYYGGASLQDAPRARVVSVD